MVTCSASMVVAVYIVLNYASSGELYQVLKRQPGGAFTEERAAKYIAQLIDALIFLHEKVSRLMPMNLHNPGAHLCNKSPSKQLVTVVSVIHSPCMIHHQTELHPPRSQAREPSPGLQ